jgi:hypothetical protein
MTRRSRRETPSYGVKHVDRPYVPMVKRPGDKGSAFREAPLAEPRAQQQFLMWLATHATVVVGCVLAVVVVTLLALVATRV